MDSPRNWVEFEGGNKVTNLPEKLPLSEEKQFNENAAKSSSERDILSLNEKAENSPLSTGSRWNKIENQLTGISLEEKTINESDYFDEMNDSLQEGWVQFDNKKNKSSDLEDATPSKASITVNKFLCENHTKWVSFDDNQCQQCKKNGLNHEFSPKNHNEPRINKQSSSIKHPKQPFPDYSPSKNFPEQLLPTMTYIPDIYDSFSFDSDKKSRETGSREEIDASMSGHFESKPQEMKQLSNADDDHDTDSNFSDEIYDLNVMENDSLLKDTRKQFPDESLFQASSVLLVAKEKDASESLRNDASVPDNSYISNEPVPLDQYPHVNEMKEWMFFYRYPDHKKKLGSREWVNVKVTIKDDTVCISGRIKRMEIVKEVPLHPFFAFTLPVLHKQNGHGSQPKVHSVKLQYVKYKEKRKVTSKFQIEHLPSYTPVLKLASKSIEPLKNFIDTVENVVRKIESHRDIGITHRHEEIFIDCDDVCQYEIDGLGRVKRYNITCQVRLRAFVTGAPDLLLFLNDIETYNKQKSRRGDIKLPKSNRWIKLENVEYHPCVNVASSKEEGGIVFKPPDGCSFELMRFRVRKNNSLPLHFKGCIDFTSAKSFEIKAECKVCGEGKLMRYRRNGIVIKFAIPSSFSAVFVRSRSIAGSKRYIKAKSNTKTFAPGIARQSNCFLEVSTGSATYEPEYNALVWRLGDLPLHDSQVPADAVQTLNCHITLPFEIDLSEKSVLVADVEFELNHAVGSEIQVQEILLPGKGIPDKWVCYKAAYSYKVLLNTVNEQRLALA